MRPSFLSPNDNNYLRLTRQMLRTLFQSIASELFPERCRLCGDSLAHRLGSIYSLCSACSTPFAYSPFQDACGSSSLCNKCGDIFSANTLHNNRCIHCSNSASPIGQIRSLFYYDDSTSVMLKKLKYCHNYSLATSIGKLMADKMSGLFSSRSWDLVLPIPSSRSALMRRGYNHTGIIAKSLCKNAALTLSLSTLKSSTTRVPQASLSIKERLHNVRNAFFVKNREVHNLRILLIDDTTTSGATLMSAAHSLITSGAKSVDAYTFLRSYHFSLPNFLTMPS